MPEFRTFNLGNVIQTAEAIKGMRRQAETDKLRDAYLGVQTQNAQQHGVIAGQQEQRAQSEADAKKAAQDARIKYLQVDAINRAPDPVAAIRQYAPDMIAEIEQQSGPGSFERIPPDQLKAHLQQIAPQLAAKAGISLNGTPEQQFAAAQAEKMDERNFSQQKELAAIQQKYGLEQIDARGKYDSEKAATANERKTFKDIQSLRKEFEGMDAVKNYKLVLPLYERAANAPNTRAGDISIIYALGKMFDPTSVVREGELILAKDAAPWLRKIASTANSQLTGKGALDKQTRADILQALKGQVSALEAPFSQERDRFARYAQENRWDPAQVVGMQNQGGEVGQGGVPNKIINHPSGATIEILPD